MPDPRFGKLSPEDAADIRAFAEGIPGGMDSMPAWMRDEIIAKTAPIVIPCKPPPGVVAALRNFVEAVEAYGETGVWPDNGTIRRLAEEGRDALNCGHS